MLGFVGDIIVVIQLQKWIKIQRWASSMYSMWKSLKDIQNIIVQFWGNFDDQIPCQSVSLVRSVLFGGLSCLSSIVFLSLNCISFSASVGVNNLLAIEQILCSIFANNKIFRFQLFQCNNFPILPEITTLQSIDLWSVSFRRYFNFMKKVVKTNPQLRSIECYQVDQWRIDEHLFRNLQVLAIKKCENITVDSTCPSNIKRLNIWNSNIGKIECLSQIFPRLFRLTALNLTGIRFDDQLLCTIPSPHLQELHIFGKSDITNYGMQRIDERWPGLKNISIKQCTNVTEQFLHTCKFTNLLQLQVDKQLLKKGKQALKQLKRRGIKVSYY